jgi:dTDP-4-dehydrorhamnose reductase
MKAFVTGALGQLGQDLRPLLGSDTVWTDRTANAELGVEAVDIIDEQAVRTAIEAAHPTVIYHCAAYTNVDGAEADEATARAVNVDGTRHVAEAANAVGVKLVIISTDFVFDGQSDRPYKETDEPHPLSVYGQTKLEAEAAALAACDQTFVVRTAWLYGPRKLVAPVKNFPQTMRRLAAERSTMKVVNDQTGSPTFSADLAAAIIRLTGSDRYGIWHIANSGQATWYEFACEILKEEIAAGTVTVQPISTAEYSTPAQRPQYSVLDSTKFIRAFGPLRSWSAALLESLDH